MRARNIPSGISIDDLQKATGDDILLEKINYGVGMQKVIISL